MMNFPAPQALPEYFDHDADVGVVGRGPTLELAFESAAHATFALMTDLRQVKPTASIHIAFEEADLDLALVTWLNRLLAEARTQGLALSRFRLVRDGHRWQGKAWGEPWREGLERGVEVKGATLTMLEVGQRDGEWVARCVVDV